MSSMRTFMDIADDGPSTDENIKNAGLSFDPSYFKAKKEVKYGELFLDTARKFGFNWDLI